MIKMQIVQNKGEALKVFGDYGWLIRERYEAI